MQEYDGYLDRKGFCRRFGVAERTEERMRERGDGPPYVRLGMRRIVYRLSDCEAWAADRTFAHRAAELARTPRPSHPGAQAA